MQRHSSISSYFWLWLLGSALVLVVLYFGLHPDPTPLPTPLASQPAEKAHIAVLQQESIPPFDPETAEYVLTVFSEQGMRHVSDSLPLAQLLEPGNVLVAQLFMRGDPPSPVTEDVVISYTLPQESVMADADTARQGQFTLQAGTTSFVTAPIRILPYSQQNPQAEKLFFPYPVAHIEARKTDGTLLVSTKAVVPVTSELGCKNCHGGNWKEAGSGGIGESTMQNIFAVHDRRNNTNLQQQSTEQPVDCRSCHNESTVTPQGQRPGSLSSSIHGFHALMGNAGDDTCYSCHPGNKQKSVTAFQRDVHESFGITCTMGCHAPMPEHSISLLKTEAAKGNERASLRIKQITEQHKVDLPTITARVPYENEPDCQSCHDFNKRPSSPASSSFMSTKNADALFSRRYDDTDTVRCASCHGSPHAIYPATNPLDTERDNMQPLQYQNLAKALGAAANCQACHTEPVEDFIHHALPAVQE